jgi:hypothetical protein
MKIYLRRTIEEHWTLELDDQVIEQLKSTEGGLQHLQDDEEMAKALFNYFRRYAAVLHDDAIHPLREGATIRRARVKPVGGEEVGVLSPGPGGIDEEAISKGDNAPDRLWERDPEFGAADSIMIRIDPSELPDT